VRHREDLLQVISQLEGVRRFRDVLQQQGHTVVYAEVDGGHDFESWQKALPAALRWALPTETRT
jgi:enterochelin esterase family protein